MLPTAGAAAAILAGSSHAWAGIGPTSTATTPAGATTTSTLTWDVSPTTGSVSCQLSWDDGSGTPVPVGTATTCPFTNSATDPNQVAYAVPGQHAGRYALVVSTPSAGSATSAYVDVAPAKPAVTGPTGPSNNRTPGWTITSIDPEAAVTCSATSPQLVSVAASCTPLPDASGHGTVSLNLASATNDASITVQVTVTAHGESSSVTAPYALDVTAPTPATLTPATASGAGRTPSFAITNVESGAAVACTVTDPNQAPAPALLSACDTKDASLNLNGAADGSYTLAVRLTDVAGNSSTSTATYTLLPSAPVVTAPASPAVDDHPGFAVSDSDPGVTLTCTLSGLAGATLGSPCGAGTVVVDLSGANDGTVQLTVTATDAGMLANSGSATYTVDRHVDAPTLSLDSTSGTGHGIGVHAGDTAPDLASLTCTVTDAAGATVVAAVPCAASTTIDLPAAALDGDYTVSATATDSVGNTATTTATYTLVQSLPVLEPLPAASTNRVVAFSFGPGADASSVVCSVSGPGGWSWSDTSCTSPGSFTIPSTGLDGDYVLTVTVTDHLNHQATASGTYTLVQSLPVLEPLPAASTNRVVAFSFDPGADASSVVCSVSGPGGWSWSETSCTSPGSFTIPSTGLDGDYVLTVTVTDHLNHEATASRTYTLLPSAPYLTGPAPAATSNRKPAWTIADDVVDVVSYKCTSSVKVITCGPTVQLDLTGLADGTYSVNVDVVDSAGATSPPLTLSIELIPPAPSVVKAPASPASTLQPSWTIADGVVDFSHYTCSSSVHVLSCTSTVQLDLTGLVDGTYSVTVRAVDRLGVAGDPVTLSFTLVPPSPFVIVAPASPASSRLPHWTLGDAALDAVGYTCSATGPGGIVAPALCSAASSDVSLDLTGLVDGTYALTVRALDAQGNVGDPVTIDYTLIPPAPVPTASAASPSSSRAPQWTLTDGAIDLDHYTCTSRVKVAVCGSTVQLDLTGLVDGTYSVTVRAVDSLGVAGDPLTLSVTMIPPAPLIVTPPVSPASALTPSWTIRDDVVDFGHFVCSSSVKVLACGSTVQLDLTGLTDGTYTVTVQAVDTRGAAGDPLILSYTLIPPAPVAAASPTSPSAARQPAWSLTDAAVGAVTYVCSAGGPGGISAPVSCSSGATLVLDTTGLPDGTYTVVVRAVDALGAAGDAATFSYLLVPPPPTVVMAPASPWNSRAPQWSLADDVAGVSYTCSVSGPSRVTVSCTGGLVTLNLTGAADGLYAVSVLAVDALGHTSDPNTPLRLTYRLDTTPPPAAMVGVTPSPSQGRTATYTISGVEPAGTVTCSFSAPSGATVGVPTACGTGTTINLTGQPDGSYVLQVTVTDVAGNASAATVATYVLDTTPPAAPIVSITSPGNDVTPTPTLVVEPGAALTCTIQRYFVTIAANVPCGTDGTVDLSGFADGEFEISVWATDVAGNVGAASSYVYVLDTVAPATPLVAEPATPSPIVDPAWRWTPEVDTTATCSLAARNGSLLVSAPCGGVFTADLSAQPDGTYTFTLVVSDPAGNVATVTSLYVLDRTAPVPPTVIPPASPDNSTLPRWIITTPRGATLTCTLMRGRNVILGPGACPVGGVVSLAGQPDGTYTLRVTATDSAGNVSAPSITSYILDTQAPTSPILVYGSPSSGSDRSPYWGFTLPQGTTGRCELWLGGSLVASRGDCSGSISFTLNGDGRYTVRLYAVDAAGNVSAPLVVGYDLTGSGHTAAVGAAGTGDAGRPRHPDTPAPATTVQRILDRLNSLAGQTTKKVRQAAGGVAAVLPTLPLVHDPLTTNVSHAVQNAINAVSRAGGGTGFPLLLLVIVFVFLLAQSRIDRRDPKLAFASVAAEDSLAFRPPPSRGDLR